MNYGENILKYPLWGKSMHTFVRGYRTRSQMDVNTINGANLSYDGYKLLRSIYLPLKMRRDSFNT